MSQHSFDKEAVEVAIWSKAQVDAFEESNKALPTWARADGLIASHHEQFKHISDLSSRLEDYERENL